MSDTRPFSELTKDWSPQRKAEVKRGTQRLLEEQVLYTLQRIAEPPLDPYEMSDDEYEHLDAFDAFKRCVRALGGELEMTVRLPGRKYSVTMAATTPAEEAVTEPSETGEAVEEPAAMAA